MPNNHWTPIATRLRKEADRIAALGSAYPEETIWPPTLLREAADVLEGQSCQHSPINTDTPTCRCVYCSVRMRQEWVPVDYDPKDEVDDA